MCQYSKQLIEKTIEIWQPHSAEILTQEDAIEIIDNTVALFDLILELERKYGQTETNI